MIKKAIIPIAGMGTRFLPLSKVLAKEFWPLVDKPTIQYILEEAAGSGIKKIIFVLKPKDKKILKYLKKDILLEKSLKKRKNYKALKLLKELENFSKKISLSFAFQKEPLGDGQAVLEAKKLAGKEPCLVLFGDDIVEAEKPSARQLIEIFNQYKKPVIGLFKLPQEKLSSYGIAKVEKIGPRLYKIKDIVEKPAAGRAPSNLAIVGKYVIDADVFKFLEKSPKAKGEIRLAGAFSQMLKKGMALYGYQIKGKWLECGTKTAYLKSNLYLSLKHPQFGKELKSFIKKEKLI